MNYWTWVALLISVLTVAGCATTSTAPTPNIPETVEAAIAAALPTETPNIDATIDASIQATLAAVPTPTEANTPVAVPTLTLIESLPGFV